MNNATTTKPSLETCAELFRAAKNETEERRVIESAKRHGYTVTQVLAEFRRLNKI